MQVLHIYGDPEMCRSDGCDKEAAVEFRNETADGVDAVVLCLECWQTWRAAYWQAETDVSVTVWFGKDDGEAMRCD